MFNHPANSKNQMNAHSVFKMDSEHNNNSQVYSNQGSPPRADTGQNNSYQYN
jgi:hypothetical protein